MPIVSGFTLYCILMLDSFCSMLSTIFIISLILGILVLLIGSGASDLWSGATRQTDEEKAIWASASKWGKRLLAVCFLSLVVNTFLPSTRTAAMIVVIPAIANNDKVQKEAGELYYLAKMGLARLVTEDAAKPKDDDK
jgi:hypothetical protein